MSDVKTLPQMMDIVLAELVKELRRRDKLEEMCVVNFYPGTEVAADYGFQKNCKGMAYVQAISSFPTESFPEAATSSNNCTYSLAHTLDMGIIRPVAIPEERNQRVILPTAEENNQSTIAQMEDMDIMHQAIKAAARDIEHLQLGSYVVEGPSGGVITGHWGLTVGDDDF